MPQHLPRDGQMLTPMAVNVRQIEQHLPYEG